MRLNHSKSRISDASSLNFSRASEQIPLFSVWVTAGDKGFTQGGKLFRCAVAPNLHNFGSSKLIAWDEPLIPPKMPQPLAAGDAPIQNLGLPNGPIKYWVKRFLACNPFYLVSAALLLYGFYRVSVDANVLRGELAQLWFTLAGFDRANCLGAAAAAYCVLCAASSRNPKLGLLGALAAAVMAAALSGQNTNGMHWGVRTAMAFLLLHSLRWVDSQHAGASTLCIIAGLVWAVEAFVWPQTGGAAWMTFAVAGPVLAFYLLSRWLTGHWGSLVVPAAAVLAMLSGPTGSTTGSLYSVPAGLMAVIGSSLLFGLGTLAALTKHRWNRTD